MQRQLSDALAFISRCDFPEKWTTLLPELVTQLQAASDMAVVTGVLETAAAIFERFRAPDASEDLLPLRISIDVFAAPMTGIFTKLDEMATAALKAGAGREALGPLLDVRFAQKRLAMTRNALRRYSSHCPPFPLPTRRRFARSARVFIFSTLLTYPTISKTTFARG